MRRGLGIFFGALLAVLPASFGQTPGEVLPPESPTVSEELRGAETLRAEAKVAQERGDLDRAQECYKKSLEIVQSLAPGTLAAAKSLNGLGDVAQGRGLPALAEERYQQALVIIEKIDPQGPDAANSLHGLANVARDRGDFPALEKYANQSLVIRQRVAPDSLELAASLNDLGLVYIYRGDRSKAEETYKQALAIQEKHAPESLAVAETLRNLGSLLLSRQEREKAEAFHRQALAIRQKLAPDSLLVAESLRWLGICMPGNPSEQEKYYRQALAIEERLAPGSLHVAWTLARLSEVAQVRGDLSTAEKYQREALAIWNKLAPGSAQSARLESRLGDMLVWRGDLGEAERYTREALEINRKLNPGSFDVAEGLFSLANIAIARGDLITGDGYYREALAVSEKLNPGGPLVARMYRGLGSIAEARGDLAQAEDYYRRALAIWEKSESGSNHVAQGLFTVGLVTQERGDLTRAEEYYQRALAIWEKLVPGSLFVAQDLDELGQLAQAKGDLGKAEGYERRAVAIQEQQAPASPDLAVGLNNLGDVLLARRDLAQAEECYRRALAIREKLLPGTSAHAASLAAMAEIMRRKNQPKDAAQYYQQALDALEKQTARLGGGDELRASFRARHASYYRKYIDLLLEQKQPELAFQVLERFRARTLLETLAMAHTDIRKGVDPELLSQERSLEELLTGKTQRRIQLLGSKNREAEIAVLDKEIQNLSSKYQEVKDRIRAGSPGYAALMQPQPISAKEAQEQLLDENTVLLEYSLGEERSHVWALTRDSVATYELPKRSEIESVARRLYSLLATPGSVRNPRAGIVRSQEEQDYEKLTAALGRMILSPVASQLAKANRLLIVSDGALQYIPFAALPDPKTMVESKKDQALPLLVEHEIVNLPSASVVVALRREVIGHQKPVREVAVLADPVFDKNDVRVAATTSQQQARLMAATMARSSKEGGASGSANEQLTRAVADVSTGAGPFLRRLPFSRREARAILSVTPSGQGMQALDFQASRATLIGAELSQYRVLHFATHGILDSEHPELSGLIFSLVNARGEPQNGFLGLQDVYNLNLSADLVVLSACETGLGKEIQGEGLVGLTQGFMYAGAPQVVASLWSVDDAATAELMARFYRAMEKEGMRPSAALRQAQMEIVKQERWKKPYYWAGFVIHGDRR
jgi:CHAT domain-containing protein/Tfp pilus assembly protein PilF